MQNRRFRVFLKPGAGRIYALAEPESLNTIKKKVLTNRYTIERDLLLLEVKIAEGQGCFFL